jgi:hypothetical protein
MAAARDFATTQADGGGSYSPPQTVTRSSPARITLHLGVVDVPYANEAQNTKIPQARKGKANKPLKLKSSGATKTTGDVAEILEAKYGIMEAFAMWRMPDIAKSLEESLAGELETLLMGGQTSGNPFKSAESAIETMFKNFLGSGEVEHSGLLGVPTQAALNGVNHRLAHPYAKSNPRRESFIDTGGYQTHFKAWVA